MKKLVFLIAFLGPIFYGDCGFSLDRKVIGGEEIKKVVICGSTIMVEKKNGDVFVSGSGDVGGRNMDEYFSLYIDRCLKDNFHGWEGIARLFDNLVELGREQEILNLLPEIIDEYVEQGKWLNLCFLLQKYNQFLEKINEDGRIRRFLEQKAELAMKEGGLDLWKASTIYEYLQNTNGYIMAEFAQAEEAEQKKEWEYAARHYERAGDPVKSLEMWEKQLIKVDGGLFSKYSYWDKLTAQESIKELRRLLLLDEE